LASETLFVFLILLVTIILFVSDRLRLDVVQSGDFEHGHNRSGRPHCHNGSR